MKKLTIILLSMCFVTGISAQEWDVMYDANQYPDQATPSWDYTIFNGTPSRSISSGVLVQNSPENTPYTYKRNWNANDETTATVETRLKVSGGGFSFMLKISNGSYYAHLNIDDYNNRVQLKPGNDNYNLDVSQYHTYKVTLENGYAKLYIDGSATPVLETNAGTTTENEIYFGNIFNSSAINLNMDYLYYKISPEYYTYDEVKSLHPDKKLLGYVSATLGIAKVGVTGTILFDIDDLRSTTNDGQIIPGIQDDEWMTVWFDASVGAGLGLPVNVGCVLLPGQDKNIDPWFAPGVSFTILGAGAGWTVESAVPSLHCEVTLASFSVDLGTLYAVDIRKTAVIEMMIASIIGEYIPGVFYSEMSDFMLDNYIDLIFLPNEFNPDSDVRHYSVGDELPEYFNNDDFLTNSINNYTWWSDGLHSMWSGETFYDRTGIVIYDVDQGGSYTAMSSEEIYGQDTEVSAHFRLMNDRPDAQMYLFSRVTPHTDPGTVNCYAGIAGVAGGSGYADWASGIWKTKNGQWTKIADYTGTRPSRDEWHILEFSSISQSGGTELKLTLNGELVASTIHTDLDLEISGEVSYQPAFTDACIDKITGYALGGDKNNNGSGKPGNKFPPRLSVTENSGITAFPNPATDIFTIVSDTEISNVKITDLTGRLIQEICPYSNSHEFDLSKLSKGVYIFNINTANHSVNKKIIVE